MRAPLIIGFAAFSDAIVVNSNLLFLDGGFKE